MAPKLVDRASPDRPLGPKSLKPAQTSPFGPTISEVSLWVVRSPAVLSVVGSFTRTSTPAKATIDDARLATATPTAT